MRGKLSTYRTTFRFRQRVNNFCIPRHSIIGISRLRHVAKNMDGHLWEDIEHNLSVPSCLIWHNGILCTRMLFGVNNVRQADTCLGLHHPSHRMLFYYESHSNYWRPAASSTASRNMFFRPGKQTSSFHPSLLFEPETRAPAGCENKKSRVWRGRLGGSRFCRNEIKGCTREIYGSAIMHVYDVRVFTSHPVLPLYCLSLLCLGRWMCFERNNRIYVPTAAGDPEY